MDAVLSVDEALEHLQNVYFEEFQEAEEPEYLIPAAPPRDWILLSGRKHRPCVYDASRH